MMKRGLTTTEYDYEQLLKRRRKKMESLKYLCTANIARHIKRFLNVDFVERLPYSIKDEIIKYITSLRGFHNNDILKMVVHKDLMKINLSTSTINDETLEILSTKCPQLKKLHLTDGNYNFTNEGLINNIPKFTHLKSFRIKKSNEVDNRLLHELSIHCPNIDSLDISGCAQVTDECLESLEKLKLKELNLSNTNITNSFLQKLQFSSLRFSIEEIHFNCCSNITGAGLETLRLAQVKFIGMEGVKIENMAFLDHMKNLRSAEWTIPFF